MKSNIELVDDYLADVDLGFSTNTVQTYRIALHSFINCYEKPIAELKTRDIEDWITPQFKKLANASIRVKEAALHSFLDYCVDEDVLSYNPFIKIKPPKVPRRLPKPLNRRDLFLLKEAAKGNRRYRAMIELLHVTGIRVSELRNIQCQDIYWEDNKIWIREAKARERFVYFSSECKAYLKIYAARRKVGIPWFFYNNRGKPLTRQGIWKITKSLLIKAGLDASYIMLP
jgi:integrase/recombinase XerD